MQPFKFVSKLLSRFSYSSVCNVYLAIIKERHVNSKKAVTSDKGGKVYVEQWQAAGNCVISDKGGKVYDQFLHVRRNVLPLNKGGQMCNQWRRRELV